MLAPWEQQLHVPDMCEDRKQHKIRAKYRAMVSLLNAVEENNSPSLGIPSKVDHVFSKLCQNMVNTSTIFENIVEKEGFPEGRTSDQHNLYPSISLDFCRNSEKDIDWNNRNNRNAHTNGCHFSLDVASPQEDLMKTELNVERGEANGDYNTRQLSPSHDNGASKSPANLTVILAAEMRPYRRPRRPRLRRQSLTDDREGVGKDGPLLRRISDSCVDLQNRNCTMTSETHRHVTKTVSIGVNTGVNVSDDDDQSDSDREGFSSGSDALKTSIDQEEEEEWKQRVAMSPGYGSNSSGSVGLMTVGDRADPDEIESVYLDSILLGVISPDPEEDTPIVSNKGTVRGMKNKVKVGIAVFDESQDNGTSGKNYRLLERGKVVLYTTSVMVVRETHERCLALKKILENHMIQFEERDVFLCKDFQKELMERLGQDHFALPQIFVNGFNLGGPEDIERLNETGILRKIFRNITVHKQLI